MLEILASEEDVVQMEEVTKEDQWLCWNGTFDKLLIFGLLQYEKRFFVDRDMMVLWNIDHLLDPPSFVCLS